MSRDVITRCDQCEAEVPSGTPLFYLNAQVACFRGDELLDTTRSGDKDLCSQQCVVAAINDLIRVVSGTAPANGTHKGGAS